MILALYHNGGEYPVPRGVRLKLPGIDFEKSEIKRYARAGANVRGDGSPRAVKLVLDYEAAAGNDQEVLNSMTGLSRFLRAEDCGDCYLRLTPEIGDGTQLIEFPVMRFKINYMQSNTANDDGLDFRFHSRSVSLLAEDADPEDDVATEIGPTVLSDGETLAADNTGDGRAFPVIFIRAVDDLFYFALQNLASGFSFSITDQSFTEDRTYRIDFNTGKFELFEFGADTGTERRNTLTAGGPWFLKPGPNSILFSALAGRGEVTISYRRTWFLA